MDASMGGRIGPSPPPPPLEKINVFFLIGGLLIHDVAPFLSFFCYLSPCPWGGGLFGLAPPSLQKFLQAPCSGVVGNFSCGSLSWHDHYPIVIDLGGGVPA